MAKQFEDAFCRYGAPMGRTETIGNLTGKARCFKVNLTDGYDDGGAYWGTGKPLYCVSGEEFQLFFRADNRKHAKVLAKERIKNSGRDESLLKWKN